MSAPIGRMRLTTDRAPGSSRRRSGRWRAVEAPLEVEPANDQETDAPSTHPPFYPFALRRTHDGER